MNLHHLPVYSVLFLTLAVLLVLPAIPFVAVRVDMPSDEKSTHVLSLTQFVEGGVTFTQGNRDFVEFSTMVDAKEQISIQLPAELANSKVYINNLPGMYAVIENGYLKVINSSETSKMVEGVMY